jgi:hypothetical protein
VAGNPATMKRNSLMNQIEVNLTPDYREIADKKLYLAFSVQIDGGSPLQNTDDDFDIVESILSTRKDGNYFIWTCACGVPGCAGYFNGIQVCTEGDSTYWMDRDLDKNYSFGSNSLRENALALEGEIKKWNSNAKSNGAELNIWPSWSMQYLLAALGSIRI